MPSLMQYKMTSCAVVGGARVTWLVTGSPDINGDHAGVEVQTPAVVLWSGPVVANGEEVADLDGTASSVTHDLPAGTRYFSVHGVIYSEIAQQILDLRFLFDASGAVVEEEWRNAGNSLLSSVGFTPLDSGIRATLTFTGSLRYTLTTTER